MRNSPCRRERRSDVRYPGSFTIALVFCAQQQRPGERFKLHNRNLDAFVPAVPRLVAIMPTRGKPGTAGAVTGAVPLGSNAVVAGFSGCFLFSCQRRGHRWRILDAVDNT